MVKRFFYIKILFLSFVFLMTVRAIYAEDRSVSFIDKKGKLTCRFSVELAITPDEHERGLMFRKYLCNHCGMLFIFEGEGIRYFWMKNTYISLDMIFIDAQLQVVHVERNAKPMDERSISSIKPSKYVLEINGGKAKSCGIQVGSRVRFSNISMF